MSGVRSALIVATYEYDDHGLGALRAPERDAEALAAVLSDPAIGGFHVDTVVNRRSHDIGLAVARFFHGRKTDDLLLAHFSCHGVKDDSGELYFAARDTGLELLEATAVSSSFVSRAMDRCRAGRVLLFLDCCYSGAFARGMQPRVAGPVDVNERLGGRGRAVITASSALQFAFEGSDLAEGETSAGSPSVFTSALVRGLATGEADRDQDGWVSLDELYDYVHDEVTRVNPEQTPKKWAFEVSGDLYVARRGRPVTTPSPLPGPVVDTMNSLFSWERESVVKPLRSLLLSGHPGRALAAKLALQKMATSDDSDDVKAAAAAVLVGAGLPIRSEPAWPIEAEPSRPLERRPLDEQDTLIDGEALETGSADGQDRPWWRRVSLRGRVGWRSRLATLGALALIAVVLVVRGGTPEPLANSEIVLTWAASEALDTQIVAYDVATKETRVLSKESDESVPTVSPDREWIAYLKGTPSVGLVGHVSRIDGSDDHLIVPESQADECPYAGRAAWSPSGGQLAFVCWSRGGQSLGLWVTDADGDSVAEEWDGSDLARSPTWRTDDVVYARKGVSKGDPSTLWAVSRGEDPRQLTFGGQGSDTSPAAYGSKVLFRRTPLGGGEADGDAWLFEGGKASPLTTGSDVNFPVWSPGGGTIAWITSSVDQSQLMTLTEDGEITEQPMSGVLGAPGWR